MMTPQSNGKPQEPGSRTFGKADVARRAYEIWEREGRPHGHDWDHWLAAEREIAREAHPGTAISGTARAVSAAGASKPKRPRARKPASPAP